MPRSLYIITHGRNFKFDVWFKRFISWETIDLYETIVCLGGSANNIFIKN